MTKSIIENILDKISEGDMTLTEASDKIHKMIQNSDDNGGFLEGREGDVLESVLKGEFSAEEALLQLEAAREGDEYLEELCEDDGFSIADEWDD